MNTISLSPTRKKQLQHQIIKNPRNRSIFIWISLRYHRYISSKIFTWLARNMEHPVHEYLHPLSLVSPRPFHPRTLLLMRHSDARVASRRLASSSSRACSLQPPEKSQPLSEGRSVSSIPREKRLRCARNTPFRHASTSSEKRVNERDGRTGGWKGEEEGEKKREMWERTIVRRRDETQTSPRRRFRASSTSTSRRCRYLRFWHHRRRCRSSYVAAPSCRQGREYEDSASLMTQVSRSNFFLL